MMIKKERLNMNTIIWCFSGSLWLSVILLITVLGRTHDAVNTWGTFFSTFYTLLEGNLGILYDILFNMVMFVPVGYLARMMFPEKSSIAIAFALSLLVEVMQLVTQSGLFELSDLIFNTAGGVIGVKIVSYAKKFNKYFY
jgi:glycopeptide antibiotics resistance protein